MKRKVLLCVLVVVKSFQFVFASSSDIICEISNHAWY